MKSFIPTGGEFRHGVGTWAEAAAMVSDQVKAHVVSVGLGEGQTSFAPLCSQAFPQAASLFICSEMLQTNQGCYRKGSTAELASVWGTLAWRGHR